MADLLFAKVRVAPPLRAATFSVVEEMVNS
jgi:hypothetical protein